VASFEWWYYGHGLRRAGEDRAVEHARFLAAWRGDPPTDARERRDRAINAEIHAQLAERSTIAPTMVWGWELDLSDILSPPNAGVREFVDAQMHVWLAAAEVYLRGVPSRECCNATGDFIVGRSEAPGEFEECVRCRSMLVAHEVAWEMAARALPHGVPPPKLEANCPPLDDNAVNLPRALLRLAIEVDSAAAKAEAALSNEDVEPVEPRVPIASGIGPLWDWLASLGPKEFVPGMMHDARRIMLGPELGTFEITRVVSPKLMEVSMPARRTRTTLTRKEMVRALTVHRRDVGKASPR
jgi:hypothetical protein